MNLGLPAQHSHLAQEHRRNLLRLLLAFTVLFGAVFIVINFIAGKYLLMSVEVAVSLFALWLLPVVKRTPHLRRWSLVYLITLYTGIMYAFAAPTTAISVFSWILVLPVLAHLLLGRMLGGICSAVYLAISAAIFLWRFGAEEILGTPGSIANVVTVTACSYLFSHVYEASRERAESQLSQMALTDSLTGLANRSQLEQSFERALLQRDLPLSLVMIDLDYFKRINDDHGHATGDAVLRAVAEAMHHHIRQTDLACRLGGEEFCLLLPNTDLDHARQMAERLRQGIEALHFHHGDIVLRLTASSGLATATEATAELDPLLHIADQHLYKAKLGGRNRVAG
jgi:diguanylate cyclase (GGDEF)-like protein